MFKTMLIAIDGSELGAKALDTGLALARAHNGSLLILNATDPVSTGIGSGGFGTIDAGPIIERLEEGYREEAKKLLDAARQKAEAAGVTAETLHVPRRRPAEAILDTAKARGSDLIVMGSHGRRGLGRLLLGSQAAEVLAHAQIPVLIVK